MSWRCRRVGSRSGFSPVGFTVLALWFLNPAQAVAQGVEGTVSDPMGRPLVGVKVLVQQTGDRVWTNGTGRYRIERLEAGPYTLRAGSDDFESVEAQVVIPDEGIVRQDLRFTSVRGSATSIEVVGKSGDLLAGIPGSVYMIQKEELSDSRPIDANEMLRRVPGVNLREDSGPVGMRLNIGIRGLNPDRSRKVLMLEDGIPISLAPYGEPEMYYSPPIDRMKRVEVLKGSGQIVHGPQTVGGVVNFVTPDPPSSTHGRLDIESGQREFFAGQGSIGGSSRNESAGWFLNFLRKQGQGFRHLYFDINDFQSKFTLKPVENHSFALKLGFYDETSNSTYLGLTSPMFLADPNQNAVANDLLGVRRHSGSLVHTAVLNPSAVLMSALFAYGTVRDWRRQDWDRSDRGRDYLGIMGDPGLPGGAVFLRNSTGNRNRRFSVAGIQTNLAYEHEVGGLRGKLNTGIRYVYEGADDRRINGDRFDSSTGILRDDEDRFGKALSFYLQNRFFFTDRLILTPGVRVEDYRYERHILRQRVDGIPTDVDIRRGDHLTRAVPGLGLSYHWNPLLTVFGGVHRGFSPPRTKDAITRQGESLDLEAELSWNWEAGVRVGPHRAVRGEVTLFRLDFENQIIPAAESGGATTTLANGGETLHQGLETSLRIHWNEWMKSPWVFYTDFRYTYLPTARFINNLLFQGNRLPYAPENTFSFLVGFRQGRGLGVQVDASYLGNQFGDNRNTFTPSPDGTVGLLPQFTVWNLGLDYTFRRERFQFRPYVAVKNLTNKIYISSRAPQGIQPGLFRQVNVGLRFTF